MRSCRNAFKIMLFASVLSSSGCGDRSRKLWEIILPNSEQNEGDLHAVRPEFSLNLAQYSNCEEIQGDIRKEVLAQQDFLRRYQDAGGPIVVSESASGPGATSTNTQETDVDEADFFKVAEHHIFAVAGDELEVVDRTAKSRIGAISVAGLTHVKFYATGDRLIVLGQQDGDTSVRIYQMAAGALPTLVGTKTLHGSLRESRVVGERLITLLDNHISQREDAPEEITVQAGAISGVACSSIYRPYVLDNDLRLTTIASINFADLSEEPTIKAMMGGSDQFYMSKKSIYLAKHGVYWGAFGFLRDAESQKIARDMAEKLVVTRVDINAESGAFGFVAVGEVRGRVKDQWAFKEYANGERKVLAIATTTYGDYGIKDETTSNHLYSLTSDNGTLKTVAEVHGFGLSEDIRAVRYVDDKAYVVTFKKTDPLFVIDMKNPEQPTLLGELQVPGFSVYLHPVGNGRLLGVGFDAEDQGDFAWYQGVQVSLFDVSKPLAPTRLDNHVIGDRGSSSEVTGDHHAFFFDKDLAVAGVPVIELAGKTTEGGWEMGRDVKFSGAILYQVGGQGVAELARVSHSELIPEQCRGQMAQGHWWQNAARSLDVERIFVVDDAIMTMSRFGLKFHDAHDPKTVLRTVIYPEPEKKCEVFGEGRVLD